MENKKNFYIDGKWVTPKSKEEIKVIDPATEENCAVISLGNKDDVNDAVSARSIDSFVIRYKSCATIINCCASRVILMAQELIPSAES